MIWILGVIIRLSLLLSHKMIFIWRETHVEIRGSLLRVFRRGTKDLWGIFKLEFICLIIRIFKSPSVLIVNWLRLVNVRRLALTKITIVAHGVHSLRWLITTLLGLISSLLITHIRTLIPNYTLSRLMISTSHKVVLPHLDVRSGLIWVQTL